MIYGTKTDAQKALTEALRNLDQNQLNPPTRESLAEYLERWFQVAAKQKLRRRTFDEYHGLMKRYIIPTIGRMRLDNVKPLDIQTAYAEMRQRGLSPRTVQYTHAVLRSALNQAIKWQLISLNPAIGVELPKDEADEDNDSEGGVMRVLDLEETRQFIATCRNHRYGTLFLLAVTSGLRPSEYLGLRWEDLNFEAQTLTVRRSLSHYRGGGWGTHPTKRKRSTRVVKLVEPVVEALVQHKQAQDRQRQLAGSEWEDHDFVFTTRTGGPLQTSNVRRAFKKLIADLDIAGVRLYDLRHTAATVALSAGVKPKVISEQLGHASVAFTMDTYSHVLPHMQDEAVEQVESHLWSDEVREKALAHYWHTNAENGHPPQGTPFSESSS